ncbi:junctional adhesion molecule-like isoform X1 [Esox lucius]|uniref:junctional adhesion molecule-like isoform X1 n=2 Tax=Esox lucius TaxID=8010 RepID=UPI0014772DB6|nr:junctional adhesion molecule-like isoform X1 [Esox lucius]
MEIVTGLVLLMLRGLSDATATTCDATQKSSQCFVALGGTLDLKLMTSVSGCELQFKKNRTQGPEQIFIMKKNKVSIKGPTEGRSEFFMNNGTFRLTNVERADSGQYFLEVYNSDGSSLGTRIIQLVIKGSSLETKKIQLDVKGTSLGTREIQLDIKVTTCNATQKSSQCFVALGGTLDLKLMNNVSGCELQFKKNRTQGPEQIFIMKKNKVSIKGPTEGRSEFFMNNGTFRLTNVERADSGQYFLEVYNSDGSSLGTRIIQLDIKGESLGNKQTEDQLEIKKHNQLMVIIAGLVGGLLLAVMLVTICKVKRCPAKQTQDSALWMKMEAIEPVENRN